jgi:uncharacterized protein (DUF58 family)
MAEDTPYVSLADVTEIELLILRRMRASSLGQHRSTAQGAGFDFHGLRDWQPGDRPSSIDWAQSTLTNHSPLLVREFEQPSNAVVTAVADVSRSTRCGAGGPSTSLGAGTHTSIAALIARAIATIGMSAVFFQDPFGIVTFDEGFAHLAGIRPRSGKRHLVRCLDAYQYGLGLEPEPRAGDIGSALAGRIRTTALVPVISDFLFENVQEVLRELSLLSHTHDVFLVLIDSAFAFDLPEASAGWIETVDAETGRTRAMTRREFSQLAARVRAWQEAVQRDARDLDLDVVSLGPERTQADIALAEFVAERRLRKTHP